MLPNPEIINTLKEAYSPCRFFDECIQAKWNPEEGFIPRGFLGATGELDEVEAVFVFAEPSHPKPKEHGKYSKSLTPEEFMELTTDFAYYCYSQEKSEMHKNTKYILNQVWPSLSFKEQLRKVWMTESRLCSIKEKTKNIPIGQRVICSDNYLRKQLILFPNARIVAFGDKAKHALKKLKIEALEAGAVSAPGSNFQKNRESWKNVIRILRSSSLTPKN